MRQSHWTQFVRSFEIFARKGQPMTCSPVVQSTTFRASWLCKIDKSRAPYPHSSIVGRMNGQRHCAPNLIWKCRQGSKMRDNWPCTSWQRLKVRKRWPKLSNHANRWTPYSSIWRPHWGDLMINKTSEQLSTLMKLSAISYFDRSWALLLVLGLLFVAVSAHAETKIHALTKVI